jgi:alpha,alpha-trehalose phosphorylase
MQLCPEAFTPEQKACNFDYYEHITVRDSSLSACTQAVLAAEVGHLRLALDYAAEAALIDLHDIERNVRDGLHIASLAGTWIALVNGFGGLRDDGRTLAFSPRLPDGIASLTFRLRHRGNCVQVSLTERTATYRLTHGEGQVRISHFGEALTLAGRDSIERPIPPAPSRTPPTQPPGREPERWSQA